MRDLVLRYRVQLALCSRIAIAASATLAIGHMLDTPMVLWAVLTAVILTQMSVGRSVKATIDYSLGTVGGALYAGVVTALVPVSSELALIGVLTIAIAPLALLAAFSARFTVAPSTGVIVVLAPTITHVTPFVSAYDRVLEVALGGSVALVVSHMVFPARARVLAREAAAEMLDLVARALPELFAGFTESRDAVAIQSIQRGIGAAFSRLDRIEQEAQHERVAVLGGEPDLGPLLRALLRMRHDLVMIGRAAATPLPDGLRDRLGPLLENVAQSAGRYGAEIVAIRSQGALRNLRVEQVEQVFALSFALEQWRRDIAELARYVSERAS